VIPISDSVPRRHIPVVTYAIVFANVAVFAFELTLTPDGIRRFFYLFGIVPERFTHPAWAAWVGLPVDDYWPFFTSMFIHGGWFHIIMNMWAFWIFGDNVEDTMGPLRFAAFYVLCGLAAGVTHVLTNAGSQLPTVGASGAIAGVMGAYLFLFPRAKIVTLVPVFIFPFFFDMPAVLFLVLWFALQFFSGLLSVAEPGAAGGIAVWAHVGGFATGFVLGPIFAWHRAARRPLQRDEYAAQTAFGHQPHDDGRRQ